MNKENQVLLIERFIISNDQTFVINQVNDELSVFYLGLINYYADKQNIKINIDNNNETTEMENDLFGLKEIKIFYITNTKKLNSVLKTNCKKIIFTDYKNYKQLNSKFNCINGYKFELDIVFFIKNELRISNDDILYYCKNNPVLLFSETSKFLINNNHYIADQGLVEEKNHILDIRKSIFEIKKINFNTKNLYLKIKREAEYKKLSFLTY